MNLLRRKVEINPAELPYNPQLEISFSFKYQRKIVKNA